jgi:predicted acetyltransferase
MSPPPEIELRRPSLAALPGYVDALERGWSPDNVRGQIAADEHLARIAEDAAAFVASLDDPEARGAPITLLDGTRAERLPGYVRWIWEGDFCGSIGLRWRPGTGDLPAHVLGHIGYAITPWKRGRGYATAALALLLPGARAQGLAFVDLTTDTNNIPSQKVITANGGRLLGAFEKPPGYGGGTGLRWRIDL